MLEKRIEAIKKGVAPKDSIIKWIKEDPNLATELIARGIKTEEEIDSWLRKTPEEHRIEYRSGRYSVEDLKKIMNKGELPADECKGYIKEIIRKKIESGEFSVDQIKSIPDLSSSEKSEYVAAYHRKKIENGQYSIEQIKLLNDLPYSEKTQLLEDLHSQNIVANKYSDSDIEYLLQNDEISEDKLRSILHPNRLKKFLPCIVDVEFLKWENLPPVAPNKTDVFVLGVPGSGKSTLLSGLFHFASHNEYLVYDIENNFGAKYLNQLVDAIYDGCLIRATSVQHMQFMTCDFSDYSGRKHPLTFMEMSGELFSKIYSSDTAELPPKLNEYMMGENYKVLILAIDYEEDDKDNASVSRKELIYSLKVLEKKGVLAKVDAINVVITKWDMYKGGSADGAADFLKRKGYGALRKECEDLSEKYGFSFKFSTFSLGTFYGFQNKKYKYKEEDSKKLYEWFCERTAYIDNGKLKGKSDTTKTNGKSTGWPFGKK